MLRVKFDIFGVLVGAWLAIITVLAPNIVMAQIPRQGGEMQILFIHHSCGGQLLADMGPQSTTLPAHQCIYDSHPNGGGLRSRLEALGYLVNEASYGSLVGQDTDIHHWHDKFRVLMDRILVTGRQDELLPTGQSNGVVVFKSCYPNNEFVGLGDDPGDPDAKELTVANAKAAYQSLLPLFADQPQVLFVAMTAPPRAEPVARGFRGRLKRLLRGAPKDAILARQFNSWLADSQRGWLAGYTGGNVAVFDYYDILTDNGATDWAAFPSGDGHNSHPNNTGNGQAATAFVQFLTQSRQTTVDQ